MIDLAFHQVHGKNVKLSEDGRRGTRDEQSFCDGLVLTNRPIIVNQKVQVRILKLSSLWNGEMRFGFTNVDPDSLHNKNQKDLGLTKFFYPDLTKLLTNQKEGYWAFSMTEHSLKLNDLLFFYFDQDGRVHYGVNGTYSGKLIDELEMTSPLWAMIDIYGRCVDVELKIEEEEERISVLDSSLSSMGSMSSMSSLDSTKELVSLSKDRLDQLLVSFRRLCFDNHLNQTLNQKNRSDNQVAKASYEALPVRLHLDLVER